MCSLCGNGYMVDSNNCTRCVLNDTCVANNPCQNGGTCTLLSSPDNYTCNCTDTGYTGVNCNSIHITRTTFKYIIIHF